MTPLRRRLGRLGRIGGIVILASGSAVSAQDFADGRRLAASKVAKFGTNAHTLSADRDGTMRVRLMWDEADVDLDLYLVEPSCTDLYSGAGCVVLDSAEGVGSGQESLTREVRAGERMLILVDNLHPKRATKYRLALEWTPVP